MNAWMCWMALASGAEWTVDASASAGGDGSALAPFADLQAGLDAAQPGDSVRVLPGTYGPVQTVRPGTAGARIHVYALPPGQALVQADGRALDGRHAFHTFEGLVFDGGYGSGDTLRMGGSDDLELLEVEVRRSGQDCIDLRDADRVLIRGARIHHCVHPSGDAHGVTGDSVDGLTIADSEIYLVTGDAVQLSPSRQHWDALEIRDSLLWSGALDEAASGRAAGTLIGENALDTKTGPNTPRVEVRDTLAWGWRGVISNQGAFNLKETVDVLVERVTVYDSEIAFRIRGPTAQLRIVNAVIYDVDTAFRVEDGLVDTALAHVTVGQDVGAVFQEAGSAPVGLSVKNVLYVGAEGEPWLTDPSNLQVGEDAFVAAAAANYNLALGEGAIDAGETLPEVVDDRDGGPRPVGASSDIGAYEWDYSDIGYGDSGGWGDDVVDTQDEDDPSDSIDSTDSDGSCGCSEVRAGGSWLQALRRRR